MFALDVPEDLKSFQRHLMIPLGDEAQVEACFAPFGDSANLDASCTVCVERTIGLEIILDTLDGTPR